MNQNSSLPNSWIMSSPQFVSKSFLSLLWKNFNGSMNNFPTNATKLQTNDTKYIMNYFHQYFLQSLYPYPNSSLYSNDSIEFVTCPSIQYPMKNIVAIVLYLVVCVVGLFGNSLVIYVVLRFSKMQTVTNRYILNLAIADECFLIGIPFLLTTMYLNEWMFGAVFCKLYMLSTSITQFTSSIFLLIMSADRFIAVCHPISASSRFRTPLVSKIVSIIAWGVSGVLMIPIMFYANTVEKFPGSEQMTCNILWSHPTAGSLGGSTFILYSLVLGFAIPLCLILIFYYLVIKKLQTVGPKNKSKDKKRSHRKVTRLVLTVIAVYILCWSPYWVSQIALINSPPDVCQSKLEITIFVLVGCLGYSNSAINPILYAFLSDNFKKSFMKACLCTRGKDINAQLQVENSYFPRFGRSRGSEKLTSIAKNNFQKSKTTVACGAKDSEAAIHDQEKNKNNVCIKTTALAISTNFENKEHNNRLSETMNKVQRTQVLHTDL